jgi:hypothetical protein
MLRLTGAAKKEGPTMLPSEIRSQILQDHERIRVGLAAMHEAAETAQAGACGALGRLREETERFGARFLRHLDLEEAVLVPALREVDAWGEARADLILNEHAVQRITIRTLVDDLRAPRVDVRRAGAAIRRLAEDLAADMEHEEATLLHEDLLRDDVVSLDSFGG